MAGIRNSQALTSVFGRWSAFHDAEVVSILLERDSEDGPILEAKIHVFEATSEVDERGYYATKNHVLATLRFGGIELEYLEGFNDQNALFSLDVAVLDPEPCEGYFFEVLMNASYGCAARFRCHAIEILAVEPFDP